MLGFKHVLSCERIDLEHSPYSNILAEQLKSPEFSWLNVAYTVLLSLLLAPLMLLQCILLIGPLRLISLYYKDPPLDRLLPPGFSDDGAEVHVELCPWMILRHVRNMDVYRVAVHIPGIHTHGLIINRRESCATAGGTEVLRHITGEVLSLKGTRPEGGGSTLGQGLGLSEVKVDVEVEVAGTDTEKQ